MTPSSSLFEKCTFRKIIKLDYFLPVIWKLSTNFIKSCEKFGITLLCRDWRNNYWFCYISILLCKTIAFLKKWFTVLGLLADFDENWEIFCNVLGI